MKWAWKIFTAFGIDVYVHATFLLVVPLAFLGQRGLWQGLYALALILALFFCVLLHEFGHALTARRFGVRTRDITLLPIGGVARLERIPSDPRQEFLIAVAGPAVNVAIAILLYLVGLLLGTEPPAGTDASKLVLFGGNFIADLYRYNWWLAIFNCLPAFPMDGGRILRALLALRLDYLRATRLAVGVGQTLAFALGLIGLYFGHVGLALLAFFVYMGAAQEGSMVEYRHAFQGLPASVGMMTRFQALKEDDLLEQAVEHLLHGSQVDFPVLRGGEVAGILTRAALIDSLRKIGPRAPVRDVPLKPVRPVEADLPLDRAYERLHQEGVGCLPVMRSGTLVGLITPENLAELAMVTSAIRELRSGVRLEAV